MLTSFIEYLHRFSCVVNRDLCFLVAVEDFKFMTFHCEGGMKCENEDE